MQLFNKSSLRETEFNANNYWQKWPRVNSLSRTFGKEYNSKGRKNHNKTLNFWYSHQERNNQMFVIIALTLIANVMDMTFLGCGCHSTKNETKLSCDFRKCFNILNDWKNCRKTSQNS